MLTRCAPKDKVKQMLSPRRRNLLSQIGGRGVRGRRNTNKVDKIMEYGNLAREVSATCFIDDQGRNGRLKHPPKKRRWFDV